MTDGTATAHGAATIINALSTGKGAAFGVDLWTRAKVTLTDEPNVIQAKILSDPSESTLLVEKTVARIFAEFKVENTLGAKVETRSNIPIARGLKSSSAAANATVLGLIQALDIDIEPIEIVKLGVIAARRAGVTITGAFDDACASFFGGLVITDNKRDLLLKRVEWNADVLIYVPQKRAYSAKADVARAKLLAPWIDLAFHLASEGAYEKAMVLNGLLYCNALGFSTEPIFSALTAGARAATLSGTGPSYIALVDRTSAQPVKQEWEQLEGRLIETKTSNTGATIGTP